MAVADSPAAAMGAQGGVVLRDGIEAGRWRRGRDRDRLPGAGG